MVETKQTAIKQLAKSFSFYSIIGLLFILGREVAPTRMCAPGVDFVVLALGALMSIVLCIKNAYQTFSGNKAQQYSLVLHSLVVISWVGFLIIASQIE